MYGPPTAPPPPRRDIRAEILRWFFAAIPLLSLGLLAWVPFIHCAGQRGRRSDWLYSLFYGLLSIGELVMLVTVPDDDGSASVFAGAYTVALILGACCHAAVTGYLPRTAAPAQQHPTVPYTPYAQPPATYPAPTAYPTPYTVPTPPPASPRMRQVASELDELGEYLRREEGR